jgi:TPP-dependent 2-oxoacid decarboxylase
MGRINQTWAYDQKYVKKYGKLYGSIDFEVKENLSAEVFRKQPNKPVVGKLMIGGKSFDVTFQELDQIQRTLQAAKEVVNKKYKIGMMR